MEIIFGVSSIRQRDAEELAKYIKNTRISAIMIGYSTYILSPQQETLLYTQTLIELSN